MALPFPTWRAFPLDGALLLFDRASGTHVRLEGEETAALRQRAPRAVQFGITNRCNLACTFCSRDLAADSAWSAADAFALLAGLAEAGTLEVAFGGGEPWVFPGFADLVARLWDETPLAVSMTTNGLALTPARLRSIRGRYGQIRLSIYDDNDAHARIELLATEDARFGVNYLVTPARLPALETTVLELVARGCRDVLLLSYNGDDLALHLSIAETTELARKVSVLARALGGRAELKLDVCWGDRMDPVPRRSAAGGDAHGDCGAGFDFVVVTSARQLSPCSFHHVLLPIRNACDVLEAWRTRRAELNAPAGTLGCARLPDFGLAARTRGLPVFAEQVVR